ncbi:MAG TPA: DUF4145 domain-containing protein [Caulobacteraceae bacterium]
MASIRRTCPHCFTENVEFRIVWGGQRKQPITWNCIAICGGCGGPICFWASNSTPGQGPAAIGGFIEPAWIVPYTWPSIEPVRAPQHTPLSVASRFVQGENSFRRGDWNAAVAMYRSALDIGTKGLPDVPKGQSFFQRLTWLHDNHRITPDIRSWADHVRVEGNEALHDPDEFAEEDAKPLRFFTEMFLRYVFELPGEVRAFRGETPSDAC